MTLLTHNSDVYLLCYDLVLHYYIDEHGNSRVHLPHRAVSRRRHPQILLPSQTPQKQTHQTAQILGSVCSSQAWPIAKEDSEHFLGGTALFTDPNTTALLR